MQQVKEDIYRKQNSLFSPKDSYQKVRSHISVFLVFVFFLNLPFSNKKETYSKVGGGKYFLEDKNAVRCTVCLCLYITFTVP